jgi:hypothetical protein
MIAKPASPSETLALPERDELILLSPPRSPLSKPSLDRSSPKCEFAYRLTDGVSMFGSFSRRIFGTKPALIYIPCVRRFKI